MSAPEHQPPAEPPTAPRLSRRGRLVAALLLSAHAAFGLAALTREGIAFDEPAHLVGGLAAWQTGDYRLAVNSFLPARWAALPLHLAGGPDVAAAGGGAWERGEVYQTAFRVLGGRSDRDRLFALGRGMVLLLSLFLGLLVLRAGLLLHGEAGGLLALALHAFSPTVLAHARLVTADMAAALLLFAATWTTWRLLERVTPARLAAGCAAVSLLFLTKASAVAILPVAAVLVAVRCADRRPLLLGRPGAERCLGRGAAAGALALVVLAHAAAAVAAAWAAYGFRQEATVDRAGRAAWEAELSRSFDESGALGEALAAVDAAGLLPEAFLHAYAHVGQHAERPSFLLGRASTEGQRLFFPYVFATKTSLGVLAMLLLAAARLPRSAAGLRAALSRTAPAWALVAVYGGAAVAAGLNIGHRHLLPIYPALFVLAGGAAAWLRGPSRPARALPCLALALLAAESLLAWPHHLSFFNAVQGGSQTAWRRVVDSSLDWGQDLPRLARRLAESEPRGPVHLSYFGTDDPFLRGIEAWELQSYHPWTYRHGLARGFVLGPGLYVLSATMYQGVVTRPWPPWTPEAEAEYRALRAVVDPAFDPSTPAEQVRRLTADPEWRGRYVALHERRFVRLCRWLHVHRPVPDSVLTPSYLAWTLTEDELRAALHGPPPFDPGDG